MTDPFTILAGIGLALIGSAIMGVIVYIKQGRDERKK